jgi:hypothetical protein
MICRWLIVALPLPVSVIRTAMHGHFGSFKIVGRLGRFTLNVGRDGFQNGGMKVVVTIKSGVGSQTKWQSCPSASHHQRPVKYIKYNEHRKKQNMKTR